MNAQELAGVVTDWRDLIEVNGWCFCRHGSEYCNHCSRDQRPLNDGSIDPPMDYRKSLSVAGRIVNSGKRDSDGDIIWHCAVHKRHNCDECFNWDKLMREAGKKKDRGKVEDRGQLLGLLRSMDVHLPRSTKLPEDTLEKKLALAINFAQNLSAFSDRTPFNPTTLPVWKTSQKESVYEATRRGSVAEALQNEQAQELGLPDAFPLYQNAFIDLRQTVMHIANFFDQGRRTVVLQDQDQQEAMCIRILDAYELNSTTPLVSILYEGSSSSEPLPKSVEQVLASELRKGALAQIHCTTQEQALLRRLLYLNSTKLSQDYDPQLQSHEKSFKKSFLLPLGPLGTVHISKLTNDPGCTVCSNPSIQRCTSCLSARYCSKACQRAHWAEHKTFCRSVRDGKWTDAMFTNTVNGQRITLFDLRSTFDADVAATAAEEWKKGDGPFENVHDDRLFLVKLQRPASLANAQAGKSGIAVYDRGRTIRGYIMLQENEDFWSQAVAQMPYGSTVAKIYRWARRTGDWKLSVCLDREPQSENLQW